METGIATGVASAEPRGSAMRPFRLLKKYPYVRPYTQFERAGVNRFQHAGLGVRLFRVV